MTRSSSLAVASVAVALGCSSSGGVTAPTDTGAETSEYATFNCAGANPVHATLRIQDADNLRNLEGVTVTSPACPGVSATTQENGVLLYTFSKDQPVTARFTKPGYFTVVTEEVKFFADGADGTTFMFADKHKELFADYAATNSYAIVAMFTQEGDAGACDQGGVKVEVKGNPSVKVAYASQNTPPLIDPTLTATSTKSGVAVVGPLPTGTLEIIGTKTGCKVTNYSDKFDAFTGKVVVEPGSLTYFALQLAP